jgi:puromycin-sensitive aminopeptidase
LQNFEHIKGMLAKASPSLMDAVIINSISRFITSAHAEEINSFFVANPLPSSERRIGQSVESIRSTGKFLEAVLNSDLSSGQFWSGLS